MNVVFLSLDPMAFQGLEYMPEGPASLGTPLRRLRVQHLDGIGQLLTLACYRFWEQIGRVGGELLEENFIALDHSSFAWNPVFSF